MQSRPGRSDPAGKNDASANRGGVVCPPDARDAVPYDVNEIMECWTVDRARKSGLAITHAVPRVVGFGATTGT